MKNNLILSVLVIILAAVSALTGYALAEYNHQYPVTSQETSVVPFTESMTPVELKSPAAPIFKPDSSTITVTIQ